MTTKDTSEHHYRYIKCHRNPQAHAIHKQARLLLFFKCIPDLLSSKYANPSRPLDSIAIHTLTTISTSNVIAEDTPDNPLGGMDLFMWQMLSKCYGGYTDVKIAFLDHTLPKGEDGYHPFQLVHVHWQRGVHLQPLHTWDHNPKRWVCIDYTISTDQHIYLHHFLHKQDRALYNMTGALFDWFRCCTRYCSKTDRDLLPRSHMHSADGFKGKLYNKRRNWFSAELVAAAIIHIGLLPGDHLNPRTASPSAIYDALEEMREQLV